MIRTQRLKKRLRAKHVAKRVGMRLHDYLDIEYGKKRGTLKERYKIYAVLKLPFDAI